MDPTVVESQLSLTSFLCRDAALSSIAVSSAATAAFEYDADGKQVKATVNGTTTYYVGNHYEVKNSVVTKYRCNGKSRGGKETGNKKTSQPIGKPACPSLAWGYLDYNARMYDPQVGRFTSADTIVPGGVQGLDRYAYVDNSPVNYVDPTGHQRGCKEGEKSYACLIRARLLKENEKKTPTILILVCGDKTGQDCETGYGPYGDDQPLSDYEEWADANGIQVEYFGFGEDETIGDVQARIEEFMEKTENAGANFLLVGHSAGADAAWNAAYSQAEKGNASRIRGVLLLDAGAMEINRDDMNYLIGRLINKYGIDIKSFSSGDYRGSDDNGKGTAITLPSNTISIPVQSHYALAVDDVTLEQTLPILNGWIPGN